MCRSVPQIPVLWTRIRTSLMPMAGTGTSRSSRPGPERTFTKASIEADLPAPLRASMMRVASVDCQVALDQLGLGVPDAVDGSALGTSLGDELGASLDALGAALGEALGGV